MLEAVLPLALSSVLFLAFEWRYRSTVPKQPSKPKTIRVVNQDATANSQPIISREASDERITLPLQENMSSFFRNSFLMRAPQSQISNHMMKVKAIAPIDKCISLSLPRGLDSAGTLINLARANIPPLTAIIKLYRLILPSR